MKKKVILSILVVISAFMITGCGNNETNIENNSNETTSNENINKDVNYNELYYNKLIERHNNNDYENYGTYYKEVQWTMIDLTKDEIPELVLYFEGDCSACKYMEFYTIKDNNVKELYFSNGDKKDSKIDGFTDIYNYDNNYYVYAFNQGYGWFGKINVDGEKISFEKVASMNAIFDIEYENKELYENIQKDTNKVKFKLKKDFIVNKSESETNNNNNNENQETKSSLQLNKYYTGDDALNINYSPYLKFINDKEVEINFDNVEELNKYKTKYDIFNKDGIEYVRIYATGIPYISCDTDNKGYALLKIDGKKLYLVTDSLEGIDMSGTKYYVLYDK